MSNLILCGSFGHVGAGLYYHSLFWGCKTNKPCDICRWVGWAECLPSSLSIVWEQQMKHLGIASIDRRFNQMPREFPLTKGTGSYFGVPALLSLMKATFNDLELNIPFLHGMGMSFPFAVAVLTQCHLFSQFLAHSCQDSLPLPVRSMV